MYFNKFFKANSFLLFRYVPEGNMTSCTVDYLTEDLRSSSYVLIYACAVYFVPLFTLIYNYTFIVRAVSIHEENLREQAKKMNVSSLRANADQQKQSAECRLAKVKFYKRFSSFYFLSYTVQWLKYSITVETGWNMWLFFPLDIDH